MNDFYRASYNSSRRRVQSFPEMQTSPRSNLIREVLEASTWYQVLNVHASADSNTIRRAYINRSKALHPDKNVHPHSTAAFQKLGEAYRVLSNPRSKEDYDLSLSLEYLQKGAFSRNGSFEGILNVFVLSLIAALKEANKESGLGQMGDETVEITSAMLFSLRDQLVAFGRFLRSGFYDFCDSLNSWRDQVRGMLSFLPLTMWLFRTGYSVHATAYHQLKFVIMRIYGDAWLMVEWFLKAVELGAMLFGAIDWVLSWARMEFSWPGMVPSAQFAPRPPRQKSARMRPPTPSSRRYRGGFYM
ncbi:uncharacterized protein VTP21DRAFT_4878 [Calcarisporiella thermophila]|uniref:uncharacterized protein n=1 Tax=Calcarisporiella thermophila TaxID=911321 RepID=UPI00374394C2